MFPYQHGINISRILYILRGSVFLGNYILAFPLLPLLHNMRARALLKKLHVTSHCFAISIFQHAHLYSLHTDI
jgi:hypothetical protein